MKKTITSFLIIFSGVCFIACSQNKTEIMQNINITENNIVEEISKQVRNFSSEKIYKIRFSKEECFFDVFIDDIPVFRNFNDNVPDAFEINNMIFKKGHHKVFYRVFPSGKVPGIDSLQNTLTDKTQFELIVKSYDLKNEEADDIVYLKHSIPMIEEKITDYYSKYKFEGAGKTYYEGSFEINVDVPYELHPPFENAQDLRKMDKKTLETKLLNKYKQVWNVYKNKEYDNIARLEFYTLRDLYVSNYDKKETIDKNISILFNEIYKSSVFEMQPIENYKLEFFADGKLAALMLDTTDNNLRGNTALWAKVNYDGGLRRIFLNRYFYIPQGETEFKVY